MAARRWHFDRMFTKPIWPNFVLRHQYMASRAVHLPFSRFGFSPCDRQGIRWMPLLSRIRAKKSIGRPRPDTLGLKVALNFEWIPSLMVEVNGQSSGWRRQVSKLFKLCVIWNLEIRRNDEGHEMFGYLDGPWRASGFVHGHVGAWWYPRYSFQIKEYAKG